MAAPLLDSESPTGPPSIRPRTVLAVAVLAAIVRIVPIAGLSDAAHGTLVILVTAAGLWITEALPVAVTALLIPVLAVLLGVSDAKGAFAGFGDPIVFLFLGTFLLTDAAFQHGLNARLARTVLSSRWVAQHPTRLLWAVAALGCAISAWVNNTATTALILPLALTAERFGSRKLLVGTLLMCSYAPSLGGLATPVGTAPNLIGLRLLEQVTGSRPSFAQWCLVFAPLAVISTALTGLWLARTGRGAAMPAAAGPVDPSAPAQIKPSGEQLPPGAVAPSGPWSLAERTLAIVFIAVVLFWITPGILVATPFGNTPWVKLWQARLPEPAVPILGALLLFVLPSGRARHAILDPGVLKRVDWSTLLLFGGGLSLGALMFDSGLARAMGEAIFHAMPIGGMYGIVLAATLMAVLVSELTSNTASASLVVPVVLALAQAAGVNPLKPALAATVACSFGFMLPVSTPPNALVYGTGRVTIREMVAHGLLLDVLGVLLVSVWVTLFA